MKIYAGKLSLKVNEDDLKQAFEAYGKVEEVKIIKDKYTGESRGFAFIEMPTKAEALAAISGLNGKELKGDTIVVNEARPRSEGKDRGGRRPSY
jgi:cold-inducible RNA-binding protein